MSVQVVDLDRVPSEKIIGGHVKIVVTDQKVGAKNHIFALGVFSPGEGLYPHRHPKSEEIYHVIQGEGVVFEGEGKKPIPIHGNMLLYIPANVVHGVTNTGKEPLIIGFYESPGVSSSSYKIVEDIKIFEEKVLKP